MQHVSKLALSFSAGHGDSLHDDTLAYQQKMEN